MGEGNPFGKALATVVSTTRRGWFVVRMTALGPLGLDFRSGMRVNIGRSLKDSLRAARAIPLRSASTKMAKLEASTLAKIAKRLKRLGHSTTYGTIHAQIDLTVDIVEEVAEKLPWKDADGVDHVGIEWTDNHTKIVRSALGITGNISALAQALEKGSYMPERSKAAAAESTIAELMS